MADKLSESLWTAFTKKAKLDLDDGALVKALAKFDKTDEAKPEPRIDALKEVVDQVKKQVAALTKKKKELGDKPFGEAKDKLYLVLDLAETLQKETEAAASSTDEEADSPVLLTTKMVPLVRELRKGGTTMNALICTAGRNTAVLIMRKAIATTRRKLLQEAVDAKGGAKFIVGEVLLENKALTFVVQSPAAGLAKRLRQALLDQLQLRLKVRVRGDDGAEDVDGEDEDSETESETEGSGQKAGTTETTTETTAKTGGTIPKAPPLPGSGPASAQAAYTKMLREVQQRADEALRAQHPEATKIRGLLGFASEKADEKQDYAAAIKTLEMLTKLLDTSAKKPTGEGSKTGSPEQALADWQTARNIAVAKLKEVAAEIAAAKHEASGKAILEINAVMKNLTPAPASMQQVTELKNWLGSDDVVNDVCELADDIRTPLLGALEKLQASLA